MKKVLTLSITLLALAAAGCVNVRDHLTLNADGTGSVDLQVVYYMPEVDGMHGVDPMDMMGGFGGNRVSYPPINQQHVNQLFPGEGFEIGPVTQEKTDDGGSRTTVRVAFSDVNKLLASPYAKAHELWMGVDEQAGTFTVKARTGMNAVAALKNFDPDQAKAMMGGMSPPGLDAAEMKKHLDKLHVEFRVTMPGPAAAPDAQIEGHTATWTIDRQTMPDDAALDAALDRVMVATCPADAVNFAPQSPMRLSLDTFDALAEGRRGEAPAAVDEAKIKAAIKFVPVMFSAQRTFDYTGEAWSGQQMAQLQMLLTLPQELAPQRWGDVEIQAAQDNEGNDLLIPAGDEGSRMMHRHMMSSRMMRSGGEETDGMDRQLTTLML